MKTSCIITNFNYAPYVCEAIESARAQTVAFDEIVVVDDGSSDGSNELIRAAFDSKIIHVAKPSNEGQLAAFISGVDHSTGDLLFFLDADDIYEPHYLERALGAYRRTPSPDFVFCSMQKFGATTGLEQIRTKDHDFGLSVLRAYFRRRWIGGPTSSLSMRRHIFEALRPSFRPADWRISADICLVYGSGLVGAHKVFVAEPLVRYRTHNKNNIFGVGRSAGERYVEHLKTNRFVADAAAATGLDFAILRGAAFREFRTIPMPDAADLRDYLSMALARTAVRQDRIRGVSSIIKHYLASRRH